MNCVISETWQIEMMVIQNYLSKLCYFRNMMGISVWAMWFVICIPLRIDISSVNILWNISCIVTQYIKFNPTWTTRQRVLNSDPSTQTLSLFFQLFSYFFRKFQFTFKSRLLPRPLVIHERCSVVDSNPISRLLRRYARDR